MPARITVRNTLGRRIELFEPFNPPLVKMYVCGPTPYDYTHIGHARSFVVFDGIKRYLNLRGYSVYHIQNITNIDDKIINKSRETGKSWQEIADYYTRDYLENLEKLNIKIDIHPRVTDHIKEIIEFVSSLIDKGYAYVAPSGSVYFEVDKYPDYGRLSGRHKTEQWSQEEEYAREKKKPYDFALWKAAKPGEPYWESPWGRGRPGWHIECSVMSTRYAGGKLDIHGGGMDLIFPHHENERAQSEAYLGESPWVKYWLHTGYLTIEGEKMSKSLGNIIVLRDAIKEWGSGTLRLWFLSGHYRKQLEYSQSSLQKARRLLQRIESMALDLQKRLAKLEPTHYLQEKDLSLLREIESIYLGWHDALSNDFNFAKAFSQLQQLTKLYFKEASYSESSAVLGAIYKALYDMDKVYGVLGDKLSPEETARKTSDIAEDLVELVLEVRRELREKRMYDLADKIRSRLAGLGVEVIDFKDKSEWRWKKTVA